MSLLPVSHRQQSYSSDCLAACAAMVLDYLHVPYQYERLLKLLRTHLENGLPLVVFVNTDLLSYWSEKTGHAVVVVAIEQDRIYVNDPKFADAPKVIPLVEFESAWIEQYQEYAVIGLDQISLVSNEVDT